MSLSCERSKRRESDTYASCPKRMIQPRPSGEDGSPHSTASPKVLTHYLCIYVCMYVHHYSTVYILHSRNVWSGLYILTMCSYFVGSSLYMTSVSIHQIIGTQIFFSLNTDEVRQRPRLSYMYVWMFVCMYICMYVCPENRYTNVFSLNTDEVRQRTRL